jgi:hypothetical protein
VFPEPGPSPFDDFLILCQLFFGENFPHAREELLVDILHSLPHLGSTGPLPIFSTVSPDILSGAAEIVDRLVRLELLLEA